MDQDVHIAFLEENLGQKQGRDGESQDIPRNHEAGNVDAGGNQFPVQDVEGDFPGEGNDRGDDEHRDQTRTDGDQGGFPGFSGLGLAQGGFLGRPFNRMGAADGAGRFQMLFGDFLIGLAGAFGLVVGVVGGGQGFEFVCFGPLALVRPIALGRAAIQHERRCVYDPSGSQRSSSCSVQTP